MDDLKMDDLSGRFEQHDLNGTIFAKTLSLIYKEGKKFLVSGVGKRESVCII